MAHTYYSYHTSFHSHNHYTMNNYMLILDISHFHPQGKNARNLNILHSVHRLEKGGITLLLLSSLSAKLKLISFFFLRCLD